METGAKGDVVVVGVRGPGRRGVGVWRGKRAERVEVEKAREMAGTATAQEQLPVFSSQAGYLTLFGPRGAVVAGTCSGRWDTLLPSRVAHHAVGKMTPLQLSTDAANIQYVAINCDYNDNIIVDVRCDDTKDTATHWYGRRVD